MEFGQAAGIKISRIKHRRIPIPPDRPIIAMGCHLKRKSKKAAVKKTIKLRTAGDVKKAVGEDKDTAENTVSPTEMTAALIRPTTAGRSPDNTPLTKRFSEKAAKHFATSIMMIKEGRTTPKVAQKAPKRPPASIPTYVEILMAKGPGVLSLTAIKLPDRHRSSSCGILLPGLDVGDHGYLPPK